MSSLICMTDENGVIVATDTLATHPDGRPFKFTSKVFIVPHLKLIMAGTGTHGFLGRWFVRMNDNVVVRGIEHLNYHAPHILGSLWQGYKEELSIPDTITTTVYHFGFSEESGKMHSYRYRSADNFKSERLDQSIVLIKPECPIPELSSPDDFRTMMDTQRAIQAAKPKDEQVYIGGEIEIYSLSENGFQVCTLHRFEDHARDEREIFDNFRASQS